MKKRFKPVEMVVIGAIIFMLCSTHSWAIQIKNGATAVVSILARNASNLSQYITGLTTGTTNITVYRKNLSALSMTTNTLSEVANGLYRITLNGTHTNTTGELVYRVNYTGGDYWGRDDVVDNLASDVYADTHTTGVKVIASGIASPQAFNITGNLTGNVTNVLQVGGTAWNSGAIKTTSFTAGAIDASAIGAGAITSSEAPNLDVAVSTRGTSNLTTSSAVGSVTGAVGSVTGNVGGNLGGNVNGTVVGNVTVTNCDVAVSTRGTSNLTTSDLSNLDVAVSTRGISNLTTTDLSDSVGTLNNISAADVRNEMDTNSTKLTAINNTVQTNLDEKVSTRSAFNASTDYVQLNGTKVL